jgi:NADP-dependent aldehyde dehydrogenase
LTAARKAAELLRRQPREAIARFLERYAERIETARDALVDTANLETGLPKKPRLADVELPRTVAQLRQAAGATRSNEWTLPTIDRASGIRSCYEALGPICVFGPNNFPFAFGSVSGGDFAAAIAAGNPVIGKANSSHPRTTQIFAQIALDALRETGLPPATVQLLYRTTHADGQRLVADPRTGATGYTGSRQAGLVLKEAADLAGKPIYLELSSVNPVVILPGALREREDVLVEEYATSALMGAGQFCTNPGLVLLLASRETETFIQKISERFRAAAPGTLLSPNVATSLAGAITILNRAGGELLCGGGQPLADRCAVANTLLRTTATRFLVDPHTFQTEAFGNAALLVVANSIDQLVEVIEHLEGNLTGCVYSAKDGSEEEAYARLAFALTPKVGRLLNDKMPTGVAVSAAMNHGGPYPATGHPGFTAVGIPASLVRFGKLTCYDNVRQERLPLFLRDANPNNGWRRIDGTWSTGNA